MTVVVDSSVALKWYLEEEGADAARQVLLEENLAAPEFLLVECANVFATKARQGRIGVLGASQGMAELNGRLSIRLYPDRAYAEYAHALAIELGHSAHDCLYLAVALQEGMILITADDRFEEKVREHGSYARSVRRLER